MRFKGLLIRAAAGTLGGMAAVAMTQTVAAPAATPATTAAATSATPAKMDLGKREFDNKCAVCHGLDAKGGGPYAEQLKRGLPDLTTLARRNGGVFPVSRTYDTIEGAGKGHGTRAMPVWGVDYTIQAAEALPEMPYNQAVYVRTRIMALLEYLNQLQVK
jgi:mono/diheme cytochrome c family protein